MKFSDTLEQLDQISVQLKSQGITVEKLDRAITDLKDHLGNIEKIEENIDAIKREVLGPIQTELEQNKVAGKFSIFGFWLGAVGLVVSIATIFVQQNSPPSSPSPSGLPTVSKSLESPPALRDSVKADLSNAAIVEKLEQIERQLLFPKGTKAQAGESFIDRSSRIKLTSDGDNGIFLEVKSVGEWPKGKGLKSGVAVYRGSNQIGRASLEKGLLRSDGKPGLREWFDDNAIGLADGDVLTISGVKVQVIKIFSTEPEGRLIGDEKSGILVAINNNKEK